MTQPSKLSGKQPCSSNAEAASPGYSSSTLPASTLTQDQQKLLRGFRVVFNAVKTHFQQVEKSSGLGGAQLWALGLIQAHPSLGMTDLAKAMDIHQSTASNLVRALVERELASVTRGGSDRRTVALKIKPAGKKLLTKAPGPLTGVLPAALGKLDANTLKRLNRDIGTLIALLDADEASATKPLGEL